MSDVSRARMSPHGWVAQHLAEVPGQPRGGWVVAYVHRAGFVAVDILTDAQVADWAPLLPRWARQDDEYEPEILVDWGDDDGPG